jgi:NitT/TauT family transport system substrate-binding protein
MSVRRWKSVPCMAFAAIVALAGCSGSSDDPANPGPGGLEKTSLKVAIQPSVDAAPFWLAQDGGFFKREGLDVQAVNVESGSVSRDKMISGEVDLGEITYPTLFVAQHRGADLRLVCDGTFASPKSNELVTVPGSPVKSIDDLPGKRVAITAVNAASQILTKSVMRDHVVDFRNVNWVLVPLPNMAAALQDKQVDAAYLPEPFLTKAARLVHATPIVDVASGSTQDFPILGYAATNEWTQKHPVAMAAFQRAMLNATREANRARATWEPLVVKYAKVEEGDAMLMTQPGFASTLDARRIQRWPDLLVQLGVIPTGVNAAEMIVKQVS